MLLIYYIALTLFIAIPRLRQLLSSLFVAIAGSTAVCCELSNDSPLLRLRRLSARLSIRRNTLLGPNYRRGMTMI
jgi:hypothetical protein